MRCLPLIALLGVGCVTTTVARLSPTEYEPTPDEATIPLYSSRLPTCAFSEIAIVKANQKFTSTDALFATLRDEARELGGDAIVRVGFGDDADVVGTVIRFEHEDCKH